MTAKKILRLRDPLAVSLTFVLSGMGFLLSCGLLGPISENVRRLALIMVLLGLVALARKSSLRAWQSVALYALALSPMAGAFVFSGSVFDAVSFLAIAWVLRNRAIASAGMALDAAALSVAMFLAYLYVPGAWHVAQVATGWANAGATVLAGVARVTGPLHGGIWLSVFLFSTAALGLARGVKNPALWCMAALAPAMAVFLSALAPWIAFQLGAALQWLFAPPQYYLADADQPINTPPAVLSSWAQVIVLLAVAPLAGLGLRRPIPPLPATTSIRSGLAAVGTGALASALVLTFVPNSEPLEHPRVGFYDSNLDFSVPEPGRYGLIQAGMYGSTEILLRDTGYTVERVQPARLTDALQKLDVLVVINLRDAFSDTEFAAIWDFVQAGGGLMVMGDHTDIFGFMEPTNALLKPVGVRFVFDSAYPMRRHFAHGLELRPHPVTQAGVTNLDFQIGTGGSLELDSLAAQPIVAGRYGFSDFGNRLNSGTGAFLGNYLHEHGERLGDVVLVAAAEHGAGRVLVMGDTTSFQVLSVAFSAGFVERSFRYLAGGWPPFLTLREIGLWLMAATFILGMAFARRGGFVALGLGLAGGAALAVGLGPRPGAPTVRHTGNWALIDTQHIPAMPLAFFVPDAVGGLFTAVQRAGYLPITDRSATPKDYGDYGMLVFLDPARPLGEAGRSGIRKYLADGGLVFVTASWPTRAGAKDILDVCGLTLRPVPLGPAEVTVDDLNAAFVDAWPLEAKAGVAMETLVAAGNMTLVAETQIGAGRCLALGDSRFFRDEYFEGERDYHPGNLRLIDRLFGRHHQQIAMEDTRP
ncbi:DUF4350 domain-containing protein [Sagittula salina]|uniref:DUF4350 domain-containing protein n=1 Tax=Sagittula salina TaxID=2820268 RepID=A0A940MTQ7_9RHOB|nr:DUF4350 domain-containing protein [Sagittula salina]MBP0482789.1 hypothetical protein [Sagittula salina]